MRYALTIAILFVALLGVGQKNEESQVDSLLARLDVKMHDTMRVSVLNNIANKCIDADKYYDALKYGQMALELSKGIGYRKGEEDADGVLGGVYYILGKYNEALRHYYNYLRISKERGNRKATANAYSNIGGVYRQMRNLPEAKKYLMAGLELRKDMNDKPALAHSYNNLAAIYYDEKNLEEAVRVSEMALQLKKEFAREATVAGGYSNLGSIYFAMGNYSKALEHYSLALDMRKRAGDESGIAKSYVLLADVYIATRRYGEAREVLNKGLSASRSLGLKEQVAAAYQSLSTLDSLQSRWREAYDNYGMYIAYRDSMHNEEETKKTVQQQMQYEFDREEAIEKAAMEKHALQKAKEEKEQRLLLNLLLAGFSVVFIIAFVIYRSFRISRKKNKVIVEQKKQVELQKSVAETKQKEILDSILYAKRIQNGLLPTEAYIRRTLSRLSAGNNNV